MPKYKNSKITYYLRNIARQLIPKARYRLLRKGLLRRASEYSENYLLDRVNYYNKLEEVNSLPEDAIAVGEFKIPKKLRVYYFDIFEYLRYFPKSYKFLYQSGDVTRTPEHPSLVKSRPVKGDNANAVLLNINKVRHFKFIKDPIPTAEKMNKMIWRGYVGHWQKHRIQFLKMHFHHPLCDIGMINTPDKDMEDYVADRKKISEHLKYKFILTIEGNDVATNLKWVMSSNSVAVMPEPTYETWFMEGRLIPDFHYIRIKDDYSDLDERLNYYIQHPEKVANIVSNANAYIQQFKNKKREKIISLIVLKKYFDRTQELGARS